MISHKLNLAKRVGVTRQTIGFIEKGEFSPSVTLIIETGTCTCTVILTNYFGWKGRK